MIKLFGITREIIGSSKLCVEVSDTIHTVGDLKMWLSQRYPSLNNLTSLAVAVNNEYAADSIFISNNSEVALIPPVSGG